MVEDIFGIPLLFEIFKIYGDIMKFLGLIFVISFLVMCSKVEKKSSKPVKKANTHKLPKQILAPETIVGFLPVHKKLQIKLENLVSELKNGQKSKNVRKILQKHLPDFNQEDIFDLEKSAKNHFKVIVLKDTILHGILRGALVFLPPSGKENKQNSFSITIGHPHNKPPLIKINPFYENYPEKLVLSPYFEESSSFIFVKKEKTKKIYKFMIITTEFIDSEILFKESSTSDSKGNFEKKGKIEFFWIYNYSKNAVTLVTISKTISFTEKTVEGSYKNCNCSRGFNIMEIYTSTWGKLSNEETKVFLKKYSNFYHFPKEFKASDSTKCENFYNN
jgi:hypothetical protein